MSLPGFHRLDIISINVICISHAKILFDTRQFKFFKTLEFEHIFDDHDKYVASIGAIICLYLIVVFSVTLCILALI